MAKEIRTFGLKALRFGEVKPDGTAPKTSEMEELVRTKRDTCKISEDETQTDPFYCDQEDDPIEIFKGEKGEKTIEVDTFDYNPETLKKLKGGTVAQVEEDSQQWKVWSESTTGEDIYKAVELETRTQVKFRFPKCLILTKLDSEFKRGDVVLLRLKIKPVSPANGKPSVQILSTQVQKGTNAFESFGSTVSNVMRNLINQMLVTDKVKKMFDDFNKSIGDIYARNLGADNAIVFKEVKDKTIDFVNRVLKPEIQKGEALTKSIFDELEQQGVKMYDEQTHRAKEKGFARMSQDSADELNGQFRLMTELQKQKLNVSTQILEKSKGIADEIKMLQQTSAQQLKHLAGIEINTFQLHEMKKDIAGMKAGIDDITTKGIKIR